MEQLEGEEGPFAHFVFGRLLNDGRAAELMDLPSQVGDHWGWCSGLRWVEGEGWYRACSRQAGHAGAMPVRL